MVRLFLFLMFLLSAPLAAAADVTTQDDLQIILSLSKEKVWQREQVTISLKIITSDPFARLDSDEYEQNGFTITSLDQEGVEKDGKLHMKKEWIVFPFVAGEQLIQLPRIRYRPNSGRAIQLELPQKILAVLKLPIYVPPTMPVGTIELESEWGNGRIISTNTLYDWNITAKAINVAPQTLPAISRLLRSSDSLQILPFKKVVHKSSSQTSLNNNGITELSIPKNEMVSSLKNRGGVLMTSYQVPFKAQSFGRLELPDIAIQYFEPESGKLKKVSLEYPLVFVINQWLVWLIIFLVFVLLVYLALKLTPSVKGWLEAKRLKNEALRSLKQAADYQQIRDALAQFAFASGLGRNVTLQKLIKYCESTRFNTKIIKQQIDNLQALEFASGEESQQKLQMIKKLLVKELN